MNQIGLRVYENLMFENAASHKIVFLRGLSAGQGSAWSTV
jgi:hypothetical protein